MKVLNIDTILDIRRQLDLTKNPILDKMQENYSMSIKVNKITKKKNLLNKINYDLVLQNLEVLKFDCKLKNILMCFNRLSKENLTQIIDELKKITIDDYILLEKVSDFLFKKTMNEPSFSHLYIILIDEMSKVPKWIVTFNDNFTLNIKESIILQLQLFFEKQTEECDKETGILFFKFLGKIYGEKWFSNEVYELILNSYLDQECLIKYEYVISFLKNCKYEHLSKVKETLTNKKLPMRMKFLIEDL
jgi:hypothetical protein